MARRDVVSLPLTGRQCDALAALLIRTLAGPRDGGDFIAWEQIMENLAQLVAEATSDE